MVRKRLLAIALAAVAVVAAGVGLTVATTCTPATSRSASVPAQPSALPSTCATTLEPLGAAPLPPAPAAKPPLSRIHIEARLTRSFLDAQVQEQVPRTLASASGRSAGAAGKVSYTVSRGDFSWALEDDRLLARTPVSVSLQICKPFLSMCPVYGSCTPQLAVTASMPAYLDERFRPGAPRVEMAVESGCSIVGFDVTSRVQSIGQSNVARIERRIAKAMPDPAPWLEQARQLSRGMELGADLCLTAIPRELQQLPPRLDDEALTLGLSLRGEIEASRACPARSEPAALPPLALPPLQVARDPLGPSSIQLAELWSWSELRDALSAAWSDREVGGSTIIVREARSARTSADAGSGTEPEVLLGLELGGRSCGGLWLAATPRLKEGALVLVAPRAATPASSAQLVAELGAAIAALTIPLPTTAQQLVGTLEGLPARLEQAVDAGDVVLDAGPSQVTLRPQAAADGLQLVASRAASWTVTPQLRP